MDIISYVLILHLSNQSVILNKKHFKKCKLESFVLFDRKQQHFHFNNCQPLMPPKQAAPLNCCRMFAFPLILIRFIIHLGIFAFSFRFLHSRTLTIIAIVILKLRNLDIFNSVNYWWCLFEKKNLVPREYPAWRHLIFFQNLAANLFQ